jgi:redox-sensitive bicupin YhaK (pirin superfamily)
MELVFHKASGRGKVKQGWHTTIHQFSFADFEDPDRMSFGMLRVLDENHLKPSNGFEMHSHENMEIVTIPLEGSLEHRDTMGYGSVIRKHDVQVMSAGTGVYHSEFNNSHSEEVRFLQLWIQSRERNIAPRYEQMTFLPETLHNRFQIMLSPKDNDGALWINQECYISMGIFDKGRHVHYSLYEPKNGLYVFLTEGKGLIMDQTIQGCDGLGISGVSSLGLEFKENSKVLLIEVPMY